MNLATIIQLIQLVPQIASALKAEVSIVQMLEAKFPTGAAAVKALFAHFFPDAAITLEDFAAGLFDPSRMTPEARQHFDNLGLLPPDQNHNPAPANPNMG